MHTMVVQFGLATIPLGMRSSSWALTSGTTSGQSGSIRHALELSITMAPAWATFDPNSREAPAPIENRAMPTPVWSAMATSSTVTPSRTRPAERELANNRRPSRGRLRCRTTSRA